MKGRGELNGTISVAIDNISLSTEKCSLFPLFALPGK